MIQEIQAQGGSVETGERVLAVVAGHDAKVGDVENRFAKVGERVRVKWYPDVARLLAETVRPRFEAVILFPTDDEAATQAAEDQLRSSLRGTALFRVA